MAFRPSQWSDQSDVVYARTSINDASVEYFFDAVIRADHDSTLRITEHPIQTGANISDHAYQMPSRLTLEVRMSDAMDCIIQGQYGGGTTKSVAAYETLLDLQAKRLPLDITTRLKTYSNMLIEHISAPDDVKTLFGLKCIITFRELFTAEVSMEKVSARPQVTKPTSQNTVFPGKPTEQQGSVLSNLEGGK